MDSTLDNKVAEERLSSLEEQLSDFAREAGVSPLSPTTSTKVPRTLRAMIHRLEDWRYPAAIGFVVLASIVGGTWWWSSVGTPVVSPSNPTPLTQAGPKDIASTAVVPSPDIAQQLQPMARDLAALRQAVEQLQLRQEQLVRDNESVASQLKASQVETARNNDVIGQIKAAQIQMAQDSKTMTERLNASQEQLASLIANASAPKAEPDEPKPSSEQPKITSEIPVPRPRPPTNVTQTHKRAPNAARPQANKPQPSAWPWSAR
ncbi:MULTISPECIES: hypothetical protein [unclassified Bradyrhizobium]|uniref:hypothetical protein n=1 Tax=unclassified Bradyrhizobium TaxID=2631580 RepID=UPI001BA698A2|nr:MULTISPECIES: hypothetical protein [unclassified Bradyrhizobium]MBR1205539.1 hypothetical protein [Bradyrhizobium sp. AUGA SZCCT0124]MBR1314012.1 hypothetical protein [Bradyrhizobium sp. AUGA SZCCT0051]MBR1337866.1 hypothetical protein [Bradyrhizobium sp. AUGA SZCCT0105]MBR1360107.1 hypothetical protein [Bradyrhizobium sp. AUGA SZCCT0045]